MLPVQKRACRVAHIAAVNPRHGAFVVASGSALGVPNSLSPGYVMASTVSRGEPTFRILRLTQPVLPGHSGGGLFDRRGYLVGVISHYMRSRVFGVPIGGTGAAVHTSYLRAMWAELNR
jgi:S1-C subfamily serine protease